MLSPVVFPVVPTWYGRGREIAIHNFITPAPAHLTVVSHGSVASPTPEVHPGLAGRALFLVRYSTDIASFRIPRYLLKEEQQESGGFLSFAGISSLPRICGGKT